MLYSCIMNEGEASYLVGISRDLYLLSVLISGHLDMELTEFISRALTREILESMTQITS